MQLRSVMEAVAIQKRRVWTVLMSGMHVFQSFTQEAALLQSPETPQESRTVFFLRLLLPYMTSTTDTPHPQTTPHLPHSPPQQTWLGSAETGPSPRSAATMRPRRDWRDVKPERRSVNKGRELQILSWPRRLEQLKQRRLATNLTGSWFLGFFFFFSFPPLVEVAVSPAPAPPSACGLTAQEPVARTLAVDIWLNNSHEHWWPTTWKQLKASERPWQVFLPPLLNYIWDDVISHTRAHTHRKQAHWLLLLLFLPRHNHPN